MPTHPTGPQPGTPRGESPNTPTPRKREPLATRSDAQLIEAARDPRGAAAFAELWERYARAGIVAARSIAPELDPEDVVAEAYTRILDLTKRGRGPSGEFRPYLYRVIRSVALSWRRRPEDSDEELDLLPAPEGAAPWTELAAERDALARAFAELQPRWREVLWRTEVEGAPPRVAAEALGISPNSVSALARRARAGLREAWVRLHEEEPPPSAPECHAVREQLPARAAGRLPTGRRGQVERHLARCPGCAAAEESLTRNSRIAQPGTGALAVAALAFLGLLGAQVEWITRQDHRPAACPVVEIAPVSAFSTGLATV